VSRRSSPDGEGDGDGTGAGQFTITGDLSHLTDKGDYDTIVNPKANTGYVSFVGSYLSALSFSTFSNLIQSAAEEENARN
jgi:hypothetical protein